MARDERASMLEAMSRVLVHRGPDDSGRYVDEYAGLAFRRLSIIDVDGGRQPFCSEDSSVVCVINGEIYNHRELRTRLESEGHRFATLSDCEIVLHLYEERGVDFVHALRGMFAVAIWDRSSRTLVLARDGFGIKPLVYAESGQRLYFASEAKALALGGAVTPDLDPAGVSDLVQVRALVAPRTMFRGVHQLAAGTVLTWRDGSVSTRVFWEPEFPPQGELEPAPFGRAARRRRVREWANELYETLRGSVHAHLQSDVPVGVLLSGGLDSSGVLVLAAEGASGRLTSYSLSFDEPGFDEFDRQDTLVGGPGWVSVQDRCTHDDLENLPEAVWYAESPTHGLELARIAFARRISRRGCKVLLVGEGADELFGGYRWYHGERVAGLMERWPAWSRDLLSTFVLDRVRPRFARVLRASGRMGMERFLAFTGPGPDDPLGGMLQPEYAAGLRPPVLDRAPPADFECWQRFAQLQYLDQRIRMSPLLTELDSSMMSGSIEARAPFLDREVAALAARMPDWVKMHGLTEKYVLREAFRGVLPESIRTREKRGLRSPVAAWLRRPLPGRVEALLEPDALERCGVFRPGPVRAALDDHRAGTRNHASALWIVVWLQLWVDIFVHGNRPPQIAGARRRSIRTW